MAAEQNEVRIGWQASDFDLPATDGKRYSLNDVRGPNGLVVMFICNHCPYVKAVREKIVRDVTELKARGIGAIAISANDAAAYPEDSFEAMQRIAREWGFTFPYAYDESQAVARAYDAQCTPEFYGFNAQLELQYHGRLDSSGRSSDPAAKRELFDAMVAIAQAGVGPRQQIPAIGCSIKWK